MALDLEEQEQVDALKAWWKQYGNMAVAAAVLFTVAVAGYRGWEWYSAKQTQEAAALFDGLRQQLAGNDSKRIREVAGQIIDKYPRTVYAVDAAMVAAKVNFDTGDMKSAKAQYQWVMDHAKQAQSRDLARLRLATILLDEKAWDESLKLTNAAHAAAFDPLYNDLKGDALSLQGKAAEARAAYQAALDKLPKESAFRGYVQIKLDALGEQG